MKKFKPAICAASFVLLTFPLLAVLPVASAHCEVNIVGSTCDPGAHCAINVAFSNCGGSCEVNVASDCRATCAVNVLSSCFRDCNISVNGLCLPPPRK